MLTIRKGHIVLVMLWALVALGWAGEALPADRPDERGIIGEGPEAYAVFGYEGPVRAPIVLLGIVEAVDHLQGSLVLGHGDGTRSTLNTDPGLLQRQKVQIGDPVKVVAEGSTVRTLEPLGPFSMTA